MKKEEKKQPQETKWTKLSFPHDPYLQKLVDMGLL